MGDGNDGDMQEMDGHLSGLFPLFRFEVVIDDPQLVSGMSSAMLNICVDRPDGIETLKQLCSIIGGLRSEPIATGESYRIDLSCLWFHRSRSMYSKPRLEDIVHIQAPHSISSILLLVNDEDGLFITPMGKWAERADEIVALATKWSFRLTQNLDNDPGKVRQLKEVFDDSDGKL